MRKVTATKNQIKKFEENKEWIFKEKPEIMGEELFEDFYKEYKKLRGSDSKDEYRDHLGVFFKVTFNVYVRGDMSKIIDDESVGYWNRDESWDCWCGYLGNRREAGLYFRSVDNIAAYT